MPFVKKARTLYFAGYSIESIIVKTGIPPKILATLLPVWRKSKNRIDDELIKKLRKDSDVVNSTMRIRKKGLYFLEKCLDKFNVEGTENITAKDMKMIADSMSGIDRLHRLEQGQATDIQVYENMKPQELIPYLLNLQNELANEFPELVAKPVIDVTPNE